MEHEKTDPEELRQVLDVVSEKIPKLLNDLSDSLPKLLGDIRDAMYSQAAGENMGKAIAAFYKELKNAGIPDDTALKMTKDYAEGMSFSKIFLAKTKEEKEE